MSSKVETVIGGPQSNCRTFNFSSQGVLARVKSTVSVQGPKVDMKTDRPIFDPQRYWGKNPSY